MKKKSMIAKVPFALYAVLFFCVNAHTQKSEVTVRMKTPAKNFTESLPLGNGRLGAMVFGDAKHERIALNEISLWSGGPQDADIENAYQYLKPIQDLLLAGKNKEAQEMLQKHFIAKGRGSGYGNGAKDDYGCYQTLGDFLIEWRGSAQATTDYNRTLDIETAVGTTTYKRNGNLITQQVFSDFNNDIIWIKLSSKKANGINASFALTRKENASTTVSNNQLVMEGQLPAGKKPGMRFAAVAEIACDGHIEAGNQQLKVTSASQCWIKISAATNYDNANYSLSSASPLQLAKGYLTNTSKANFYTALQAHTATYQQWFNRNRWYMPENKAVRNLSTNERLVRYQQQGNDALLPVLYYNFGRYLLISSSRPGLLPANLQGLWATELQTPWNGDYHLNINIQMNYWLAETTNLSDLAEPVLRFTKALVPNGQKTAKAYYQANGWVAHVISNPWLFTSPGEGADWGSTLTGGAWLVEHIWEHYRFTKDTAFLRQYYPVIKGAALFLQSILIKEPTNGWLVTAPSNSPEHAYKMPNGFKGNTAMGPTMDMQICREIMGATIQASAILGTDEGFSRSLQETISKLAPNQIGKNGDLNEWLHDWEDGEPHHRHVSHMYGLHPYDEITPWKTPELAAAARKTLQARGDAGTGWSMAWKINFWARLGDGDHAALLLKKLLQPAISEKIVMHGGGTYPNLFCGHPPFQIDGNFGGVAGMAEMLLQSHGAEQTIRLLPALPTTADWANGYINGLKARGAFVVGIEWKKSQISKASIYSEKGLSCSLLLPANKKLVDANGTTIAAAETQARTVVFKTEAGQSYLLK